jgi:hypothetical protein
VDLSVFRKRHLTYEVFVERQLVAYIMSVAFLSNCNAVSCSNTISLLNDRTPPPDRDLTMGREMKDSDNRTN